MLSFQPLLHLLTGPWWNPQELFRNDMERFTNFRKIFIALSEWNFFRDGWGKK